MNILIYTMSTPRPNGGGISRMTYSISEGLREEGLNVYYLCFEKYETDVIIENAFYFPVPLNATSPQNIKYLKDFISEKQIGFIINQIPLSESFSDMLYKIKPEDVRIASVIHNSSLNLVRQYAFSKEYELRKQGKTWVFSMLRTWPIKQLIVTSYIQKHRNHYKKMEKGSDYIVAVSEKNKEDLYSLIGFKSPKVISISNFIYITDNPIPVKENLVIWCGRLETNNKRVDLIIDIWARICKLHPEWKLVLLGYEEAQGMKDYASSIGASNIVFTGLVQTENYYKKASIFCHTSISESFGLVLAEAMNWGCVPIAFDSFPACQDIISDDCGYRIKAFDKEAYAKCLSDLMDNNEERTLRAKNSKAYSQRFNADNSINEWLKIIN